MSQLNDIIIDGTAKFKVVKVATSSDISNLQNQIDNAETATNAEKLKTARNIDGVSFNGTADIIHYGICSTVATTAAKTVNITGFTLKTGANVKVKFTTTNTAANPTLNVNNTGAKPIYYRGTAISTSYLAANRTYEFVYNGNQFELIGDLNTDTNNATAQNISTANTTFPVLLGATANATSNIGDKPTYFGSGVKVNPSTSEVIANKFTGELVGNVTGNVSGSSGSCTGNAATATRATYDENGVRISTSYAPQAQIDYLANIATNSVSAAVSAKNDAETAKNQAQSIADGLESIKDTAVDTSLAISGQAADSKTVGDKFNAIGATQIDNDEYLCVWVDSENHVLFGVKKDGSFDWQKGVPKPIQEKIFTDKIDNNEFVQLTQDAEGKIIEGVLSDGTKKFVAPVRFGGGVKWSTGDINSINEGLKGISSSLFNYDNYIKDYVYSDRVITATSGLEVLYLEGDMTGISKKDKVNLTYRFLGNSGTCTLKWQGGSTLHFPKKNYTMAKMTPAIDVGWGSQKKYVLKADFSDCSHARNIMGAKLWGDIVKSRVPANETLSALPNGGAIDGFPIMLVINGEYQGLYNFNIPKDQWMLNMGSGEYEAIITNEGGGGPATQFKATVSREDILAGTQWAIEYIPDEDSPDWAIDSFNRMLQACVDSTGVNYRTTLEPYLDIESAIDYYIHCCLLGNFDGVSHNMIMGTYDGVKWFFTAYDMDNIFGNSIWSTAYLNPKSATTFGSTQGTNRVFHLIYTYDKEALKTRYAELRDSAMSENNVLYKLSNFLAPIPKAVLDEEGKLWPTTPGTLTNNFEQIMNWYRVRVKYMDEEIANL